VYKIELTKGNQKGYLEGVEFHSAAIAAMWIAVAQHSKQWAGVEMDWVPV
jgi:hypothetical protein